MGSVPAVPRIERGRIYRGVYAKRVDDQAVVAEAELERAHVANGSLQFETALGQSRAFSDGIFLLRIPDGLDLSAGDGFAEQFFLGSGAAPYGRFRELGPAEFGDPLLGFHHRINQIEQFLLERRFLELCYPPEIALLGEQLIQLSQQIMSAVLRHVAVPPDLWSRATGGCADARGSYHLTFNHYRPEHEGCGLSSHKDDGFVTILRTTAPGLEVNRRDQWERVPVDHACFVVNFGLAMEILTAPCERPVTAIMHRVSHQDRDRSSFGHFTSSCCLPGSDEGIYRYQAGTGLERICASRELIDNNDYEIYNGTEQPEESR
jgi:hypothetical protein